MSSPCIKSRVIANPVVSHLRVLRHAVKPSQVRKRWKEHQNRVQYGKLASIGKSSGEPAFRQPVLVGTFHKTGTVLIKSILRTLSHWSDAPFVDLANHGLSSSDGEWRIAVEHHSQFENHGLDPANFPCAILIRDPRDMLVSAAKYHRKSSEPWLHIPREDFGGLTYQEKTNSFDDDEARYRFELVHSAGGETRRMVNTKESPAHKDTLFVRLEDLMNDRTLSGYHRLFSHLGLNPAFFPLALKISFDHSIFNPLFERSRHITTGKTGTWRETLSPSVLEDFNRRYPEAAEILGYQT